MLDKKKSFVAYSDWYGTFKALPDDIAGRLIKHVFSYVNDENPTTDDFMVNALFEQIKSTLKRDLEKWESKKSVFSKAGEESGKVRSLDCKNQVYVIRLYSGTESFIKIGVTYGDIKKRFSQGKNGIKQAGYNYEILSQFYESNLNGSVLELESFFHEKFKVFAYTPINKFSGYTECFTENVINEIERTLIMFNETERNPTVSVNDSVSVSVNKSKSIDDRLLAFQEQLKPFVQEYGEVMIKEFYFYWTEKNLDAKKMRFEKEAVFDIKRRLARWSNNNFNSNKKTQINEQPYLPTADKAAIAAKYGKPNSTS